MTSTNLRIAGSSTEKSSVHMAKGVILDMSTDLSKKSTATTTWPTLLPWASLTKMFLRSQRASQTVLSQMTSSPPHPLIPHSSSKKLQLKIKRMKQLKSWDTKDSVASSLQQIASNLKLVTQAAMIISASWTPKNRSASSPPSQAQMKSTSVKILRHGLSLL